MLPKLTPIAADLRRQILEQDQDPTSMTYLVQFTSDRSLKNA